LPFPASSRTASTTSSTCTTSPRSWRAT
jgi:hypothetical protein